MSLKGLITGIGSLPHKNPEIAVDLILQYFKDIPFWPQLPKRDLREGMVSQYAENLPCIKITDDGIFFDDRNADAELEIFYDRVISNDMDYFKISPSHAAGLYSFYERLKKNGTANIEFIKCQSTGPLTFASSVNNQQGVAILYDEIFAQAIIKGLIMKALWQIKMFKEFGKKIVFFLDEPFMGAFGSAYTPLNREAAVKILSEFSSDLKSEGVLVGVHCCGNTDWSIFTQIDSIDIINFDAFGFLEKFVIYAEDLKKYLERGGMLCWGVVPTQDFNEYLDADSLMVKIDSGLEALTKKGISRDLLLKNLILSPSCGLGTLDEKRAQGIFKLLVESGAKVKNK